MAEEQQLHQLGEWFLNNPSLPVAVPFGDLTIHIDLYNKDRDFREVSALLKAASEEGIGIASKDYVTDTSGRSRISRRGGRAPVRGGVDLRRGHFSVKMYVKTKELGPMGGARRARPPRSANGY